MKVCITNTRKHFTEPMYLQKKKKTILKRLTKADTRKVKSNINLRNGIIGKNIGRKLREFPPGRFARAFNDTVK